MEKILTKNRPLLEFDIAPVTNVETKPKQVEISSVIEKPTKVHEKEMYDVVVCLPCKRLFTDKEWY